MTKTTQLNAYNQKLAVVAESGFSIVNNLSLRHPQNSFPNNSLHRPDATQADGLLDVVNIDDRSPNVCYLMLLLLFLLNRSFCIMQNYPVSCTEYWRENKLNVKKLWEKNWNWLKCTFDLTVCKWQLSNLTVWLEFESFDKLVDSNSDLTLISLRLFITEILVLNFFVTVCGDSCQIWHLIFKLFRNFIEIPETRWQLNE